MKKMTLASLLFFAKEVNSSAQNAPVAQKSRPAAATTYQFVKAESVKVGGIDFYYRKLGENNSGIPVIFLNHLAAAMDNCDPRIMDGIASEGKIICFDNRGVGATRGKTPKTVAEMAKDARNFIHALSYEKVDLIGFSLGGFISQEIMLQEPQLVHKAIIAGTGPAGGEGIENVTKITYKDMLRGLFSFKDPKTYLFFKRDEEGKRSAKEFLSRLRERKENLDKKMGFGNFQRQLKAIHAWGLQAPQYLSVITQPILIVNGDSDKMVPTSNTYNLNKRIAHSGILIYKDAGHGSVFQYHDEFVKVALAFLEY